MLLAGPKTYYDDYMRKQGTGRTLHDPPSLLTDRGAYVNFLEVQLERVSAACLGVNAYDQRFNDMQSLIVSLEQRCAATTRLVGLAQQCTEEVRLETDNKIDSLARDARDDHANVNAMFQAMSSRVSAAEQSIATLASMAGRIDTLEQRAAELEGTLRAQQAAREEERLAANVRLEELESYKRNSHEVLQKVQTELSKQGLDIDENNKRTSNLLLSIEERLTALQTKHKEELSEKLQETNSRISERLQETHAKMSAEHTLLVGDLQALQKESARRAELIEKSLPKAYNDAIMNAAKTACEIYRAEAEIERQAVEDEIQQLQESLQNQAVQLTTLEDEARQQFQSIDRGLGEFSETAQNAQRRAATALQEALAASMALQRASSDGLLVTGSLLRSAPIAPVQPPAPPAPTTAGVAESGFSSSAVDFAPPYHSHAPHRASSPTQAQAHAQAYAQPHAQAHAQAHNTGTPSAGNPSPPPASRRDASLSLRAQSPPTRAEQHLADSYRSRISPFFSRVPPKDKVPGLWFPTRSVPSRRATAAQLAERARRVQERQDVALARAIEPRVDTIHPPPRYSEEPLPLSHPPLRQRGAAPRSTNDIVASMMRQHMVSENDDLLTIASASASAESLREAAVRASIVPRDHLRGAAAKVTRR